MMFLLSIALIALDQLSKYWAVHALAHNDIAIIPGLNLHLSYNRGVSFGMLAGGGNIGFWVLNLLLVAALGTLVYYTIRWRRGARDLFGYLFLIAGGVSNLIDRFMHGAVIDFIDCSIGSWHWPTFNLADIFIVGGVVYIFWRLARD